MSTEDVTLQGYRLPRQEFLSLVFDLLSVKHHSDIQSKARSLQELSFNPHFIITEDDDLKWYAKKLESVSRFREIMKVGMDASKYDLKIPLKTRYECGKTEPTVRLLVAGSEDTASGISSYSRFCSFFEMLINSSCFIFH